MLRRFFALTALLALSGVAAAALTAPQLQTLKTAINADPTLSGKPMTSAAATEIASAFNANASPSWTVWKTNVTINEVGKKFNGAELASATSANQTRLQTIAIYLAGGVNPSLPDNRAFFDDIFSGAGGATTRANLLALWKRLATRGEKLYTTGTGSDASPAILTFEGLITGDDVQQARELP
jgi:hypothetical protein